MIKNSKSFCQLLRIKLLKFKYYLLMNLKNIDFFLYKYVKTEYFLKKSKLT